MTPLDGIYHQEFWISIGTGLFLIVMAPLLAYGNYRKSRDQTPRVRAMWLLFGVALASLGYGLLSTGAKGVWLLSLPIGSFVTPETRAAILHQADWVDVSNQVAMACFVLGFMGSGVLWILGKRHPRSE